LSFSLKWMVLIPAYNEATTIEPLVRSVLALKPDQLVMVNDASIDQTSAILHSLSDAEFTIIDNPSNLGKACSLWHGFEHAIEQDYDVVITMDGDGQHRAEDISLLLKKYTENPDSLVIGARERNLKTQPLGRFLANRFANFWISWAAGYGVSDSQSGFRAYPVKLLKKIAALKSSEGFVFESEVIIEAAWQGHYTSVVTIPTIYHKNRRASHFQPWQDIKKITKMVAKRLVITRFSVRDLWAAINHYHPAQKN